MILQPMPYPAGDVIQLFNWNASFDYQIIPSIIDADPPGDVVVPSSGFNSTGAAPFGVNGGTLSPPHPIATAWPGNQSLWLKRAISCPFDGVLTISGVIENAIVVFLDDEPIGWLNKENVQIGGAEGTPFVVTSFVTAGLHTLKILALDEASGSPDNTYVHLIGTLTIPELGGLAGVDAPEPEVALAFWNLYPTRYTGPCLKIERVSDLASLDIGFDANGDLDIAAIAAFCGASNGRIMSWYNQLNGALAGWGETTGTRSKIYDGATGQMVRDANGKIAWPLGSATQVVDFTVTSTTYTMMCCFQTTDTQFTILGDGLANNKYIGLGQSGSAVTSICNNAGTLSVGRHFKNGVEQAIATRGNLYTAFATGAPVRYVGIASLTPGRPTLGVYQDPSDVLSMGSGSYFSGYALQYADALTDPQIAAIDAYLAANLI